MVKNKIMKEVKNAGMFSVQIDSAKDKISVPLSSDKLLGTELRKDYFA